MTESSHVMKHISNNRGKESQFHVWPKSKKKSFLLFLRIEIAPQPKYIAHFHKML